LKQVRTAEDAGGRVAGERNRAISPVTVLSRSVDERADLEKRTARFPDVVQPERQEEAFDEPVHENRDARVCRTRRVPVKNTSMALWIGGPHQAQHDANADGRERPRDDRHEPACRRRRSRGMEAA